MADSQFITSGIISCSDRFNSRLASQYASNPSFNPSHTDTMNSTSPQSGYASSTYSTSTTYTEKPVIMSSNPSKQSSQVWKKTKHFLAKGKLPLSQISDHWSKTNSNSLLIAVEDKRPEYERQQAEKRRAAGKPEKRPSPMEQYGVVGVNPNSLMSRI